MAVGVACSVVVAAAVWVGADGAVDGPVDGAVDGALGGADGVADCELRTSYEASIPERMV